MRFKRQVRSRVDGAELDYGRRLQMLADAPIVVDATLDNQRGDVLLGERDGGGKPCRAATDNKDHLRASNHYEVGTSRVRSVSTNLPVAASKTTNPSFDQSSTMF